MKLVDNWKNLWKSLTVQVSAVGFAVTQLLYLIPTWDMVPDEVKAAIPPEHLPYVTGFFFANDSSSRKSFNPLLYIFFKKCQFLCG